MAAHPTDGSAPNTRNFCGRTRREFLWEAGAGFTSLGLIDLLSRDGFLSRKASAADVAPRSTCQPAGRQAAPLPAQGQERHLPLHVRRTEPRRHLRLQARALPARRQDDRRQDLRPRRQEKRRPRRRPEVELQALRPVRQVGLRPLPPPRHLRRRHRLPALDDRRLADPRLGHAADELRQILSGSPCLGSWVNYGLGSENENLPGFVVMLDPTGGPISGAKNWSSGYMPATYQGVTFRSAGEPDPRPRARRRPRRQRPAQAARLAQRLQRRPPRTPRRQHEPRRPHRQLRAGLQDADRRPPKPSTSPRKATRPAPSTAWTTPKPPTSAASACSPAAWSSAACASSRSTPAAPTTTTTGTPTATWRRTTTSTPATPTSRSPASSKTSSARGLLDETLVVWGGEFGRQPTAEYAEGTGRDHNSYGFTMWMAGGGIKGGVSVGATDELGSAAVEDRLHVKHLHATILHLLGLDPNQPQLLLRRPRPETRRRRRRRADPARSWPEGSSPGSAFRAVDLPDSRVHPRGKRKSP